MSPDEQSARRWLNDFGWKLADPSNVSPEELDSIMDRDKFWEWCNGKIDFNSLGKSTWKEKALIWLAVLSVFVAWWASRSWSSW